MGVANLVSGLYNRLYLKNEQMDLWLKIFGLGVVKNGCGQSDEGKMKNELIE